MSGHEDSSDYEDTFSGGGGDSWPEPWLPGGGGPISCNSGELKRGGSDKPSTMPRDPADLIRETERFLAEAAEQP